MAFATLRRNLMMAVFMLSPPNYMRIDRRIVHKAVEFFPSFIPNRHSIQGFFLRGHDGQSINVRANTFGQNRPQILMVVDAHDIGIKVSVQFNGDVAGDYIEYKGAKYTVCDPTIYYGKAGRTMRGVSNDQATIIIL